MKTKFRGLQYTALLGLAAVPYLLPVSANADEKDKKDEKEKKVERREEQFEMQGVPRGYTRLQRPEGAQNRPEKFEREHFNHNYRAERIHHIGPYHPPGREWVYRRWHYGELLPGDFFVRDYWIADYWLFGLEIPPVGYEWVRYGNDSLLVNIRTGEIIEVVYDSFG